MNIYDAFGLLGAVLILLGFYRISIGRWTRKSFLYELDNLFGALFLVIYQIHNHTYITVVLNVVWVAVAIHGLIPFAERYVKYRKRS